MAIDTQVIRVRELGGPDKLLWERFTVAEPGAGQVLVRNVAIGLNFIDVYFRTGLYAAPLPFTPGMEGAGLIEAVGPDVSDFKIGDRVAYYDPFGAYAELLLRPAERLIKLPAWISCELAAAMLLKGLTAQYLLRSTYRVKAGDTILVHAAAGGVGQILCQWARDLGAIVIGTVGSDDKVAIAQAAGCEHVIVIGRGEISERVRALTDGRGVPVVYDGVGQATFMDSINCLQTRGLLASFGNASGVVDNFNLALLSKGSLYVTRPSLAYYNQSRDELLYNSGELFDAVARGAVRIAINGRYQLRDVADAHNDLEARRTTGSTVLLTGSKD